MCGMSSTLCSTERWKCSRTARAAAIAVCWEMWCAPEQEEEQQDDRDAQQHDGGQQPLLHRAPVVRAVDAELLRVELAEADGMPKEGHALRTVQKEGGVSPT